MRGFGLGDAIVGSVMRELVAVEPSQGVVDCAHGFVVCFVKMTKRMVMHKGVVCSAKGFQTAGDSVSLQAWNRWMA